MRALGEDTRVFSSFSSSPLGLKTDSVNSTLHSDCWNLCLLLDLLRSPPCKTHCVTGGKDIPITELCRKMVFR